VPPHLCARPRPLHRRRLGAQVDDSAPDPRARRLGRPARRAGPHHQVDLERGSQHRRRPDPHQRRPDRRPRVRPVGRRSALAERGDEGDRQGARRALRREAARVTRPSLSALVICQDEERHIAECLESVAWCDEIVVVDSGSSDRTLELARKHATRVLQRDWTGIADQKNFALAQATGDWVLNLDADERCTAGLRDAARAAIESDPSLAGFEVRRHAYYLGRWIDHGGWYPDWKLRLFR